MEYKVIGSVFTMIFLAELGDKTQLATFACAAYERSKLSVFIGSSLALVLASLIATLLGGFLAQHVPQSYISRGAGVLFIIMGAVYIYKG
ncbi:MAG: TMEM165/GDT1 family protein [Nitrospinota bacterium]|nr:TMEM165/GDT1 family protein [Nitrospinota bacterium]MDH5756420.1 TMEM165/GDT1 family protein [Nitrospinota bacterium]